MRTLVIVISIFVVSGCTSQRGAEGPVAQEGATATQPGAPKAGFEEPSFGTAVQPGSDVYPGAPSLKKALFAGGCFWCMEPPFDKVDGVVATISGYAGGNEDAPQYKQVASGQTGHTEAVLVVYDASKVDYAGLIEVFWRSHDPTDAGGQFVDRGRQYRPAVFYYDAAQKAQAEKSRAALDASGRLKSKVAVELTAAPAFWPAEDYHQDFYKKDPNHYKRYRSGSGRDQFLNRVWKD